MMKVSRKKIQRLQDCKLLTDRGLAEEAGISRPTIYATKSRESCSPATAGKLAAALGVKVCEIMPEITKAD